MKNMIGTDFYWHSYLRDTFARALLDGELQAGSLGNAGANTPIFKEGRLLVGHASQERADHSSLPSMIVIQESTSADTLSWLRTFAPPTSPLSQFARVITNTDWERFVTTTESDIAHRPQHASRWAGIVLGEMLAQGDGEADLLSLPLSRAGGCFSTAIARTSLIYGGNVASVTCVDRLRKLEADRRFVRRVVAVDDLLPVWAIANALQDEIVSPTEIAPLVVEALFEFSSVSPNAVAPTQVPQLGDFPELFSDSVEERVLSFQRLTAKATSLHSSDVKITATIAAGAFLVGRGTSHSFLLGRLRRQFPAAYVWFGLMAALSGSVTWDTNWARVSRGIERALRAKFDWAEVPTTDICWVEYAWMSSVFDGIEVFKSIPKAYPRVLSIEVIPGASCQFRFVSDIQEGERELPLTPEKSVREAELEIALAQFVSLASKTRHYVEGVLQNSRASQLDLNLESEQKPKSSRPKRAKKTTL